MNSEFYNAILRWAARHHKFSQYEQLFIEKTAKVLCYPPPYKNENFSRLLECFLTGYTIFLIKKFYFPPLEINSRTLFYVALFYTNLNEKLGFSHDHDITVKFGLTKEEIKQIRRGFSNNWFYRVFCKKTDLYLWSNAVYNILKN